MAFYLLTGIILIFLISYMFLDKDFLSPVNLYLLFSTFSVAAMFLLYEEWNMNEYGALAVAVYLTGSLFFVIGCGIAKVFMSRNIHQRNIKSEQNIAPPRVDISMIKIVIMTVFGLAAVYGTYAYMRRLGGSSTLSLGQAIQNYRYMKSNGLLTTQRAKGSIWNLFSYFSIAFAYCSIFALIKNAVNNNFRKKDLLLLIPFVLRSTEYLLQSNRGGIIQLAFGAIMSWFVSMKFQKGWRRKINSKIVKTVVRVMVILIPLFFGSLILLGRYDTLEGFDFKHYALVYLSGGIRNLDQYLKEPTAPPQIFGEETFVLLHRNLSAKLGTGLNLVRYLEFRSINGRNIGNIYTSYRRFYHDFGFTGVCIFPLIQGILISLMYYRLSRNPRNDKINYLEIVYCYLSYTTIYIAIDDLFFSDWVSITGVKILIIMFAAYFFMFNVTSKRPGVIRVYLGRFKISTR